MRTNIDNPSAASARLHLDDTNLTGQDTSAGTALDIADGTSIYVDGYTRAFLFQYLYRLRGTQSRVYHAAALIEGNYSAVLDPASVGTHTACIHTDLNNRVDHRREAAGDPAVYYTVRGEAGKRLEIRANGRLAWADGTTFVEDTNLYRGAANVLKTDDRFQAVDGITTKTMAGAPTDAMFQTTPPDGTLVVDTTSSKLWVRIGGSWKSVAVA